MFSEWFEKRLLPIHDYLLPEIGGGRANVRTSDAKTKNDVTAGKEWKATQDAGGTVSYQAVESETQAGRFPELDMVDFYYLKTKFGTDITVMPAGTTGEMLREKFGDLYNFNKNTGEVEHGRWDATKAKIIKAYWSEGLSAAAIAQEKKAKTGKKQSGYSPRLVADYVAAFNAAVLHRAELSPSH